ncbi:unnamed protein product, partial [Mesorhabditis belari]|uniref:Patched domain-containing protein 3 n=1 Tax=Mesorhabditis belari TaxID=2138241 RepID=A0AAF3EM25_9BILA
MTDWNRRAEIIKKTRHFVDGYPKFETTLFDYDATIYDIIISVKSELIQAVVVTFSCMSIISTLSIPELFGASIASTSMLSITGCMLGFLSLWGCGLDPIVMINVLMAIGFSVDFSAHICYHHHKARRSGIRESEKARLQRIMESVGRPMIEAGFSTILCMLPLFFINIYAIISFAKTVCLVSSIGLFHGLILIPLILSLFPMK